jgi:hypothetical protein
MTFTTATITLREPSPSLGVNVIKPAAVQPPKPFSNAIIERIRQLSVASHMVSAATE